MKQQRKTALQVYRALNQGLQKQLPSGVTVTVRIVGLADYVRRDEMPAAIKDIAIRLGQIHNQVEGVEVSGDEQTALRDWVVAMALVDPPCVFDLADETEHNLWVGRIPEADRAAISLAATRDIREAVEEIDPLSKTATGSDT